MRFSAAGKEVLNECKVEYLQRLIKRLIILLDFADRKTIGIPELQCLETCGFYFVKKIYEYTHSELKTKSPKASFGRLVRETIEYPDIRISNNIILIIQYIVEDYIEEILDLCKGYLELSGKKTVTPEMITLAKDTLQKKYIEK